MLINTNFIDQQYYVLAGKFYSIFFLNFMIISGVGINLWNNKPTTCINAMIEEFNKINHTSIPFISSEEMLSMVMNKFETFYDIFKIQGFQPFESLYYKYWLHK